MILPSPISVVHPASRRLFPGRGHTATLIDIQPPTKVAAIGPIELKTPALRTTIQLVELLAACQVSPPKHTLADEQLLSLP
jgi:hypothetical protein